MLGHAFGAGVQGLAPALGAEPQAFALAGMGFLLAGTTHAPLTAVVMVFEMTLDYGIVVPLLLGSAVASLVATRLSANSVYTEALQRKAGEYGVHGALDVLRVADLVRPDQVTVAPDLPLPRLLDAFVASRRNHLYVVDEGGGFVGAVNLHDVNEALRAAEGPGTLAARDVMRPRFEVTVPEEGLPRVLDRFAAQECERLPVLADLESRRLVGTISKRDILSVYSLELLQRSDGAPAVPADRAPRRHARRRGAAARGARRPHVRRVALPGHARSRPAAGATRGRRPAAPRRGAPLRGGGPPRGVRAPGPDRRPPGARGCGTGLVIHPRPRPLTRSGAPPRGRGRRPGGRAGSRPRGR